MRSMLTFALLLCTTLLSAQTAYTDVWNEIDSLIAHGHYTTAYEKSSEQLKKAKRRGIGHDMLKAVYKQRVAAAAYQEGHVEAAIEAYEHILPRLKGVDKSMAHLLLAALDGDKRPHYEAAMVESTALKSMRIEDYDLLIEGDTFGLRLRPTLYDVVVHAIVNNLYIGSKEKRMLADYKQQLFGTAEEFATFALPDDAASYALWQLTQLQDLTCHHLHTADAAVRAHIDYRRMELMRSFARSATLEEEYVSGIERIVKSYEANPTEQSMFLYLLAQYYTPQIYAHTDGDRMNQEVEKAKKMESYIERISQIAPDSEWDTLAKTLYKSVTSPYLSLQGHTTLLPEQEQSITLTVRNMTDIAYRIVPRYAGEHNENFTYKEVIGRTPVVNSYYKVSLELPNAYVYEDIALTLPPLEAGDYFVIAANSTITAISVTNLKMSMILNEAEAEYIGMVLDATTGEAVTDCEIALMENSGKQTRLIERFFPDEKGYFTVPLPSGKFRNLYLQASDGLSHTTYTFRYSDFPEHHYWANSADASTLITLFPDRYTYEPGDTIHFAALAYSHSEEGSSVKSRLPIGITLTDMRYKKVGTLQGVTDEWGYYNGNFALPKDATPGWFRLQATDSNSGYTAFCTINVEAFKAPTFTAEIERPATIVRFGDSLRLQGTAITYTGLPVTDAKVRYEVTVTNMDIFGYQPIDVWEYAVTDTTTTDKNGGFDIPLKAVCLSLSNESATHNYIIRAYITDSNGETQRTQTSIIVGHRTKHTNLPNWKGMVMHGDSIRYNLLTLNGQRIAEPVTLRLSKLEVPQYTGIRASEENDWEQWNEECTFIERIEQTSIDINNYIAISPDMPCGIYRLTVTYTDGGKQYSEHCHFKLWGEGKGTESSYVLCTMATDDYKVTSGDTAVYYISTRHSDVYAHYYIMVQDRIVDKGTLCLTDETVALRIPVKAEWKGRMSLSLAAVKDNVKCTVQTALNIEDKTSRLNLHLSTLRNPLEPGEREQCTISVSDYQGNPVQAALTLSIYDAALDTYGSNEWNIASAPQKGGAGVRIDENNQAAWVDYTYVSLPHVTQPRYYTLPTNIADRQILYSIADSAPIGFRGQAKNSAGFDLTVVETLDVDESATTMHLRGVPPEASEASTPYMRQNLRHTALFLPMLRTDKQGRATFTLTASDLLTRWHVKGIAHTKELKHGRLSVDFITRKTLMVQPNVPRFLFEGDKCEFTAKVSNSGSEPLEVVVKLETHLNPPCEGGLETPKGQSTTITIEPGSSTSVSFPITAPMGAPSLTYRFTAQTEQYSDGEQATITILPRRTLVTETMALYLNSKEKREFTFDAFQRNRSETLEHHSLKFDMVSNPIWYVIEALPPLCEESNPSNEQLFHRYYVAAMGTKLIAQHPEVEGYADFYQLDSLKALQRSLLNRLAKAQQADCGWAWMEGFNSSQYVTQLIVKGMGELEAMGCIAIAQDKTLYTMVKQGVFYLDRTHQDHFDRMERKPKTLSSEALYYLYVRSMFPELPFVDMPSTAYEHYKALLLKDKATQGTLLQKALKMLTLSRMGEYDKANKIAKVVNQSSLSSDEMGIYWRDNRYGYGWDNNPITTQALLIEAFVRLGQPVDIVGRMQQWLLKQKQTTHWESTIATAQAVHALMVAAPKGLLSSNVEVKVGGKAIDTLLDDNIRNKRLGIIQKQWTPEEIRPTLAKVSLEQQVETPAWGSMTWQYYEEVDKVEASGNGLSLKCIYYKVETQNGKEVLTTLPVNASEECHKGDRIRVRLQFTADRAMDYVELRMQRPAALEPISTRSGYAYDKGLAYYRSVENERNVYYFQRIDKGSYTIECDFWISQSGSYACGLSTIQCMYAPSFMATAESALLKIE